MGVDKTASEIESAISALNDHWGVQSQVRHWHFVIISLPHEPTVFLCSSRQKLLDYLECIILYKNANLQDIMLLP